VSQNPNNSTPNSRARRGDHQQTGASQSQSENSFFYRQVELGIADAYERGESNQWRAT